MRQANVTEVTLLEEVKKCHIKPKLHHIMITVNQVVNKGGLDIDMGEEDMLDEWQYVIAAGEGARYNVGDKVLVDLLSMTRMRKDPDTEKMVEVIDLKPVESNGKTFSIISDNSVLGHWVDYEDIQLSL